MKLTVFPSDKGDCLLLAGKQGHRVLIDGGMSSSYTRYVAAELERLGKDDKTLDVVCVSHIDEDHISGILQLVDDAFLWKVFAFHLGDRPDDGRSDAPDGFKRPVKHPRPPAIGKFWYNSFAAMVPDRNGEFEAALIQATTALAAASEPELRQAALANRELVTSIRQGIQLRNRLDKNQLDLDVNPEFGGKVIQIERNKPASLKRLDVGNMRFFPIGPFKEDLDNQRKEWKEWVESHEADMRELRERWRADEDKLTANEFERLRRDLVARAKRLGDRNKVTVPNLASLMFLAEEGNETLLLTGDGHGRDVLAGLEAWKKLGADGTIHVDVLKVQHHGSEHNLDADFCRRVTADHYVFCANGAHKNPDLAVLKAIVDSRLGPDNLRNPNPRANDPFRFWFNASSTFEKEPNLANQTHMKLVEKDVKRYVNGSHGRMTATFISDPAWRGKERLELAVGK